MAVGDLNAGYRGLATIGGTQVRFSDANISAKQQINAPDLVMGDWDRDAYNYGPISYDGSISGPVSEGFLEGAESAIKWVTKRIGTCGTLDRKDIGLYYYCNRSREFSDFYGDSIDFNVSAGDVANFTLNVKGVDADPWGDAAPPEKKNAEKLITWDKVNATIAKTGGNPDSTELPDPIDSIILQSFQFNVANNLEYQYALSQSNLKPFDIIPGLRQLSGSITIYNVEEFEGYDTFDGYCAGSEHFITFSLSEGGACSIPEQEIQMKVRFERINPTLNTSVVTSTVGFTGVGHQVGEYWE
jgi:hypothetical protein